MPKLKLTYFDFHGGRGEPARLALSIGGIPFASRARRSALYRCSKWMGRHSHNRMLSIVTLASLRISTRQMRGKLRYAMR